MSESRPGEDVAAEMERDADELDERIDRLEDHISEAQRAAQARREEAAPGEAVAGDWEETRGTPGQGDDPEGAVDEDTPEQT
jgi:septal ring factor EnvC (AmiA/AmiB activator)